MKQIQMTPEIAALIHDRVDKDIDTSKLAIFEARALNTKPLPGKDGTIFERAVVKPITLTQMVDYINSGKHIPLVADHELFGAPKGRFFHAGLNYDPAMGIESLEMRAMFYLDETEVDTITKINSGSLDEVSVAFLSSQFLCSECGWDYFEFGSTENIVNRTCANDHTIGEDGVHAEMIGLNQFIELSVVARGAADNPKIVGKSQSKLAPETTYRLAARGFEPNALVVQASMGKKEDKMDTTALITQLTETTTKLGTATADVTRLTAEVTAKDTALTASQTRVSELETQLAAAKDAKPEDYETAKTDSATAVAFLQEQLQNLTVAKTGAKLADDKLPKTVADLKTQINELTGNLTSILPVGGRSIGTGSAGKPGTADLSAFTTRK